MLTQASAPGFQLVGAGIDWPSAIARVCADPGSIRVAYQPIVDLTRGQVTGYELLTRFDAHPGTSPELWFAAAARLGMAPQLEAAVLSRTLPAARRLPPNCFASVNVSPHTLLTAPVRAAFAAAGSLEATVIEVTEQSELQDYAGVETFLDGLRERGALVAVDDAGAGYASLSHITRLRPDFVKIDRALVSDCDTDEAKLAALEMLGVLAGRIDAWVVAEGIERPGELDALVRVSIPLAQGYHLGRPAPSPVGMDATVRAELVAEAVERRRSSGVGRLLTRAPSVGAGEDRAMGTAAPVDPHAETVVALDERGRPVGLVPRGGHPGHDLRPVTTIGFGDDPAAVAHRAMTRPPATRFDPLVACDGRGRYVGVLTIERLLTTLAG